MKNLVLIAGALSLGLAGAAVAGGPDQVAAPKTSGVYAGVNGGLADAGGKTSGFDDNLKLGFDLGGQVGYRFNKNFRAEVAANYLRQKINVPASYVNVSGHLNTWMLMANGYYDIDLGSAFVPFIGAGVGYIHLNEQSTYSDLYNVHNLDVDYSTSADHFAYQGIAGVAYHINSNVSVNAAYHYVAWTKNNGAHQNLFNIGLNYYF